MSMLAPLDITTRDNIQQYQCNNPMYIVLSGPSLTLEFACFRYLVVGNQNDALYLIAHIESTLHPVRIWTTVKIKSLELQHFM